MTTLSVEPGFYSRPKNETFRNQSTTLRARLGDMGIHLIPTQRTADGQLQPTASRISQKDLQVFAEQRGYTTEEVGALFGAIGRAWHRHAGISRAASPDAATDAILAGSIQYRNGNPTESDPMLVLSEELRDTVPHLAKRGYAVGHLTVRLLADVSAEPSFAAQ